MYSEGLVIKTSLNTDLQLLAEESLVRGLIQYDKNQGWRGVVGNLKEYNIKFEDIIKTLTNIGGDVYGIMHTWFQDSSGGLKIIKDHWKGPMMYYPEIHKFDTSTHEAIAMSTEDEFANSCLEFIDDQIQIIGGCCGVSDTHIKKLIEKF